MFPVTIAMTESFDENHLTRVVCYPRPARLTLSAWIAGSFRWLFGTQLRLFHAP